MKKISMVFLAVMVFLLVACQGDVESTSLTVKDAWARSALQGNPTAIYFIIDNPTDQEDVLLTASTDVSMMTELHMSSMDASGVMKMTPQENVPVPSKSNVEFKQGGLHVMLMNIKKDLKPGDSVKLTLNFEKAGQIIMDVPVKEP